MSFPVSQRAVHLQTLKIPANAPLSKAARPTNGIDPKRYGARRAPFERMNAYSKEPGTWACAIAADSGAGHPSQRMAERAHPWLAF